MTQLIIISGLSGSGKTIALQTLEDEGFFCVDNLPFSFLPLFLEKFAKENRSEKLAIGIDARGFPDDFPKAAAILNEIRQSDGIDLSLLFLAASDDVLLKRYSDTRRRHPLAPQRQSLVDSIAYERKIIEPIYQLADYVIDTSQLNVHQLRDQLKKSLLNEEPHSLLIQIESFGYRNGLPLDAHFIFDARCLTNPHWVPKLREYCGLDQPVIDFFRETDDVEAYYHDIHQFIIQWIPKFQTGTRSYLSIAIGCTGGKHRSVYLADRLYHDLKASYTVVTKHRELPVHTK